MAVELKYGPVGMPLIAAYMAGKNKHQNETERFGQHMLLQGQAQAQAQNFAYGQQQRAFEQQRQLLGDRQEFQGQLQGQKMEGINRRFDARILQRQSDENAKAIAAGKNPPWPDLPPAGAFNAGGGAIERMLPGGNLQIQGPTTTTQIPGAPRPWNPEQKAAPEWVDTGGGMGYWSDDAFGGGTLYERGTARDQMRGIQSPGDAFDLQHVRDSIGSGDMHFPDKGDLTEYHDLQKKRRAIKTSRDMNPNQKAAALSQIEEDEREILSHAKKIPSNADVARKNTVWADPVSGEIHDEKMPGDVAGQIGGDGEWHRRDTGQAKVEANKKKATDKEAKDAAKAAANADADAHAEELSKWTENKDRINELRKMERQRYMQDNGDEKDPAKRKAPDEIEDALDAKYPKPPKPLRKKSKPAAQPQQPAGQSRPNPTQPNPAPNPNPQQQPTSQQPWVPPPPGNDPEPTNYPSPDPSVDSATWKVWVNSNMPWKKWTNKKYNDFAPIRSDFKNWEDFYKESGRYYRSKAGKTAEKSYILPSGIAKEPDGRGGYVDIDIRETPRTQAEFDDLPKGAFYRLPDGREGRK
jgi:hypothetical protein